ncbi:hypothetical protein H0H93_003304, partial [Arthromyces matolae]
KNSSMTAVTISLGDEGPDSAGDHPMSEPTDSGSSVESNPYNLLERYFEAGAPPLIASAANGTEFRPMKTIGGNYFLFNESGKGYDI